MLHFKDFFVKQGSLHHRETGRSRSVQTVLFEEACYSELRTTPASAQSHSQGAKYLQCQCVGRHARDEHASIQVTEGTESIS